MEKIKTRTATQVIPCLLADARKTKLTTICQIFNQACSLEFFHKNGAPSVVDGKSSPG